MTPDNIHHEPVSLAKEDLLYSNEHVRCLRELERLQKRKRGLDDPSADPDQEQTKKKKEKSWVDVHMQLAESCVSTQL